MPLPAALQDELYERIGPPLHQVRLHTGVAAGQAAAELGALAWSVGGQVGFAAGRFAPERPAGRRLLLHELHHAVQPQRGTQPLAVLLEDEAREAAYVGYEYIPRERPSQAGAELAHALPRLLLPDQADSSDGVMMRALLPALANLLDPDIVPERDRDLIADPSSPWHFASYASEAIPEPYFSALREVYAARWESDTLAERRAHLAEAERAWRPLLDRERVALTVARSGRAELRRLVRELIDRPLRRLRRRRELVRLSRDGVALSAEELRAIAARQAEEAARRDARRGGRGLSTTIDVAPEDVRVTAGEERVVRFINPDMMQWVPHRTGSGERSPRRVAFEDLARLLRELDDARGDPARREEVLARLPAAEAQARERVIERVRGHRSGDDLKAALAAIAATSMTVDVSVRGYEVEVGALRVRLTPVQPGALVERPGGFLASSLEAASGDRVVGRASEEVMDAVLAPFSEVDRPMVAQYLAVIARAEGALSSLNTWDRLRITLGSGIGAAGRLQDRFALLQRDDPATYERLFGRHGIGVEGRSLERTRGHGNSRFRATAADGTALLGDAATEALANDPAALATMVAAGFDPAWQRFLLSAGAGSITRAMSVRFAPTADGAVLGESVEAAGATNLWAWMDGVAMPLRTAALFALADDIHGAGALARATRNGFGPTYAAAAAAHGFDIAQPDSAPPAARAQVAHWLAAECSHASRRPHIARALGVESYADLLSAP